MNQKTILKIKGVDCRIDYQKNRDGKQEIFCYNSNKCNDCCGLENCECNDKNL